MTTAARLHPEVSGTAINIAATYHISPSAATTDRGELVSHASLPNSVGSSSNDNSELSQKSRYKSVVQKLGNTSPFLGYWHDPAQQMKHNLRKFLIPNTWVSILVCLGSGAARQRRLLAKISYF